MVVAKLKSSLKYQTFYLYTQNEELYSCIKRYFPIINKVSVHDFDHSLEIRVKDFEWISFVISKNSPPTCTQIDSNNYYIIEAKYYPLLEVFALPNVKII